MLADDLVERVAGGGAEVRVRVPDRPVDVELDDGLRTVDRGDPAAVFSGGTLGLFAEQDEHAAPTVARLGAARGRRLHAAGAQHRDGHVAVLVEAARGRLDELGGEATGEPVRGGARERCEGGGRLQHLAVGADLEDGKVLHHAVEDSVEALKGVLIGKGLVVHAKSRAGFTAPDRRSETRCRSGGCDPPGVSPNGPRI